MKKLVATLSLAGLLVAGSAGVALAQDPGAGATGTDASTAQPRRHRAVKHAAKIAADSIGISTQELRQIIADGSVFVTSGGVNPALTIQALALRTAKHLGDGRSGAAEVIRLVGNDTQPELSRVDDAVVGAAEREVDAERAVLRRTAE